MVNEDIVRILVTGSNGQLGNEIRSLSDQYPGFEFTYIDIDDLDLTDEPAIRRYFSDRDFEVIINCSAYTAVDIAEENPQLAYKVNSDSVKILAGIGAAKNIRIIHISTDYVFDGTASEPIHEDVSPSPLSVYGHSKLEGEKNLLSILPNSYVLRTSWLYSIHGKNFVKTIIRLAQEKEEISVVSDQFGSPTFAGDLAWVILRIIDSVFRKKVDHPGVYHFSNQGAISWYEFADAIVNYYNLPCQVKPITTNEFKTRATRPKYSVLDKTRIMKTFGIHPPEWKSSLESCLSRIEVASSASQRRVA